MCLVKHQTALFKWIECINGQNGLDGLDETDGSNGSDGSNGWNGLNVVINSYTYVAFDQLD